MNVLWIIGNPIAVVSGLICVSYLIWVRRTLGKTPFPVVTLILLSLTATITTLA